MSSVQIELLKEKAKARAKKQTGKGLKRALADNLDDWDDVEEAEEEEDAPGEPVHVQVRKRPRPPQGRAECGSRLQYRPTADRCVWLSRLQAKRARGRPKGSTNAAKKGAAPGGRLVGVSHY